MSRPRDAAQGRAGSRTSARTISSAAPISQSDVIAAAIDVVDAYTAEAEDWNDGEFALWRKDDLVVALVELRRLVGDA